LQRQFAFFDLATTRNYAWHVVLFTRVRAQDRTHQRRERESFRISFHLPAMTDVVASTAVADRPHFAGDKNTAGSILHRLPRKTTVETDRVIPSPERTAGHSNSSPRDERQRRASSLRLPRFDHTQEIAPRTHFAKRPSKFPVAAYRDLVRDADSEPRWSDVERHDRIPRFPILTIAVRNVRWLYQVLTRRTFFARFVIEFGAIVRVDSARILAGG